MDYLVSNSNSCNYNPSTYVSVDNFSSSFFIVSSLCPQRIKDISIFAIDPIKYAKMAVRSKNTTKHRIKTYKSYPVMSTLSKCYKIPRLHGIL